MSDLDGLDDPLTPEEEQLIFVLYAYTAEKLQAGFTEAEIADQLTKKGLSAEAAKGIVENYKMLYGEVGRKVSRKNLVIGGVIFLIGVILAVGSFVAADDPSIIIYLVIWGSSFLVRSSLLGDGFNGVWSDSHFYPRGNCKNWISCRIALS